MNKRPLWCDQQTYHSKTGEVQANQCKVCPVDKECVADNLVPIACPTDKNKFFTRVNEKQCFPSLMTPAESADVAY